MKLVPTIGRESPAAFDAVPNQGVLPPRRVDIALHRNDIYLVGNDVLV